MKIGIIGLGLMGGSLGKTLIKGGEHTVFGYDINPNVMLKAEMVKAMDMPLTEENAKELDMLVISLYPNALKASLEKFLPLLKNGATVIDFCGIKRDTIKVFKDYSKKYQNLVFVGGHPMAGREFSGIDRAISTLFDKASMILVNVNADIFKIDEIKKFWLSLGFGEVVITSAEYHDRAIAYTSQLCHVVSNAYIKNSIASEHFGYSAGSYKDLTRVARLNPEMWAELIMKNADNLSEQLDEFIENLQKYSHAIKLGDKEKLKQLLDEGNQRKLMIDTRNKK